MADRELLSRRQILALFGAGTGMAIIGAQGQQSESVDGNVLGGADNMPAPYKVGESTYKGPLSVRSEVPQEDGITFIQTDAGSNNGQFALHHYNGGWGQQGLDVTSLNADEINNAYTPDPAEGTDGIQKAVMDYQEVALKPNSTYEVSPGAEYPGNAIIIDQDGTSLYIPATTTIKTPDGYTPTDQGQKLIDVGGGPEDDGNDIHPGFDEFTAVDDVTIFGFGTIDGNWENQDPPFADLDDGHNLEVTGDNFKLHGVRSINSTGDGYEGTTESSSAKATRHQVMFCTFLNNWEQCIHPHGLQHSQIIGNYCDGEVNNSVINLFGSVSDTVGVEIAHNTIKNGQLHGANLANSQTGQVSRDIDFHHNTVVDNAEAGVFIKDAEGIRVWDNTIARNGRHGIQADEIVEGSFKNNTVKENQTHGMLFNSGLGEIQTLTVSDNDILNNNQSDANGMGLYLLGNENPISNVRFTDNDVISDGSIGHFFGIRTWKTNDHPYDEIYVEGNYVAGAQTARETNMPVLWRNNDGVLEESTLSGSSPSMSWADEVVLLDASSNAVDATLPDPAAYAGERITVKTIDTTNTATYSQNGSETIDGAAEQTLSSQYDAHTVESDGTNWRIVGAV